MELKDWIPSALTSPGECGGAVAVHSDRRLSLGHGGIADIRTGRPISANTPFPIGCVYMPLLTTLALILVDKGRLSLNARIADHAFSDGYPVAPVSKQVTLEHLLNHTSGLSGTIDFRLGDSFDSSSEEFTNVAAPGEIYSYSAFGFYILCKVIETATNKKWQEAMTEYLADPLGIKIDFIQTASSAIGHIRGRVGGAICVKRNSGANELLTHSKGLQLHMTARDLAIFGSMHLADGKNQNGCRVLSSNLCAYMRLNDHYPIHGRSPIRGLGWKYFDDELYGYSGTGAGFTVELVLWRRRNKVVVSLANSQSSPFHRQVHAKMGLPPILPTAMYPLRKSPNPDKPGEFSAFAGTYVNGNCEMVIQSDCSDSETLTAQFYYRDGKKMRLGPVTFSRIDGTYYFWRPSTSAHTRAGIVHFFTSERRSKIWATINGVAFRKNITHRMVPNHSLQALSD